MKWRYSFVLVILLLSWSGLSAGQKRTVVRAELYTNSEQVDLLQRYPTTLTEKSVDPKKAREWEFSKKDIFYLSEFSLEIGDALEVTIGAADVGVGNCVDGAVWAVVIPRKQGSIKSSVISEIETIDHLWLRFHPAEVVTLFPPKTVVDTGDKKLWSRIQKIANSKIRSSWQAGGRAMIPGRSDLTVDADTKKGIRRFFIVDRKAATARYVDAFKNRTVPEDQPFNEAVAKSAFDKLWEEYDRQYPMFILRPEVDWDKLRQEYRPKAIGTATSYEFALVCAEMLKHLRDLHIWVTADGENVPLFNRPRKRNSNPSAHESIIGELTQKGKNVRWGKTAEKVGFIAIDSWSGNVDGAFDKILEQMRDTRGLIVDVRLNGGGSEPLAKKVAGRFVDKEYVYAYSQYRNGPNHPDLTEKYPRKVQPRGPWRYDRPVVLLIGQKCMSSNESFVSMMAECPQVTTMGDRTCGSSGNPKFVNLPSGIRISLPRWIDLLPDGTPLDQHGIKPDVFFASEPDYFKGDRDDLLRKAVDKLTKQPLPKGLIPGPIIDAIIAGEEAKTPHVVAVWPPDGAEDVNLITDIRIRFDRPMQPQMTVLNWRSGGFVTYKGLKYDKKNCEFRISLELEENGGHTIVLNRGEFGTGFTDLNDHRAKEFSWGFRTKSAKKDKNAPRPKLLSIDPPSGSKVPVVTHLRLTFDQPMEPNYYKVLGLKAKVWTGRCCALRRHVEYDPNSQQFTIPLLFPLNYESSLELSGFKSAQGAEAEPVGLKYTAGEEFFDPDWLKKMKTSQNTFQLRDLLENVKKARSKVNSISEAVFSGVFSYNRFFSSEAYFRMQGSGQFYADISQIMSSEFFIGSDGQTCWFYTKHERPGGKIIEKLVTAPYDEIQDKIVSICDPFHISKGDIGETIDELNLEYCGTEVLDGRKCHIIRTWFVKTRTYMPQSFIGRWWIDAETYLPLQVEVDSGRNYTLKRFNYLTINETIDVSEFRPDFVKGVKPQAPESLKEGYDTRFLKLIDGSRDGRMSVRWGQYGPKGRRSGGLN
jgi:C-terminal processing protease CtpA/Prc/outer membrane lipoprotein-sorting protein